MEHNMLSLDFWQDTVIDRLKQLTEAALEFMKTLSAGAPDPVLLPADPENTEK